MKELFGVEKPAVAMAHLPPLPGTPLYDEVGGPGAIVDSVARDVEILTGSGFDAILFCNEGDRPYQLKATMEGVAMMARVVSEVAPRDRPFGVRLSLGCAGSPGRRRCLGRLVHSRGCDRCLRIRHGTVGARRRRAPALPATAERRGDQGVHEHHAGIRIDHGQAGHRDHGPFRSSVEPGGRHPRLRSHGGAEPSVDAVREAKRGCGDETPVFANTGVKSTNVREFLAVADGVIVGSDLKVDGGTWNPVDEDRATRFMTEVRAVREDPRTGKAPGDGS